MPKPHACWLSKKLVKPSSECRLHMTPAKPRLTRHLRIKLPLAEWRSRTQIQIQTQTRFQKQSRQGSLSRIPFPLPLHPSRPPFPHHLHHRFSPPHVPQTLSMPPYKYRAAFLSRELPLREWLRLSMMRFVSTNNRKLHPLHNFCNPAFRSTRRTEKCLKLLKIRYAVPIKRKVSCG